MSDEFTVQDARALLSRFSPKIPLMVGPAMYKALSKREEIADMMDRVRQMQPLPVNHV